MMNMIPKTALNAARIAHGPSPSGADWNTWRKPGEAEGEWKIRAMKTEARLTQLWSRAQGREAERLAARAVANDCASSRCLFVCTCD